jgi:cyclopropane fatty-acyl-phospholipid synthase-like methyltransferase
MPIFKENFNKAEMTEFCEKASDSHFGGIVSTFAILHLTPAQQLNVFSQIHRILVPDGLFLFATIDNASTFVNKKAGKEKMRIGFCENYLSDKSCYEATFPVLWY